MRLSEHHAKLETGDITPRVVEHHNGKYVAWTPTKEGPARPDHAAAAADLRELNEKERTMTPTAHNLAEWLRNDCDATDVRECSVTIRGKRYDGARYMQPGRDEPMIYMLGDLPACYVRSRRIAFTGIDAREWYIASYMERDRLSTLPDETARYHPFGAHFILAPWQVPSGEAIDHFEPRPYARIPVTFEAA